MLPRRRKGSKQKKEEGGERDLPQAPRKGESAGSFGSRARTRLRRESLAERRSCSLNSAGDF